MHTVSERLLNITISCILTISGLGLLAGCTQAPVALNPDGTVSAVLTPLDSILFDGGPEMLSLHPVGRVGRENGESRIVIPYGEDPGLYLFRTPRFQDQVINFYSALTGSRRIALAILRNADRQQIALPLAFSLAWVESTFNPKAVNRNSESVDRGLFQLNSRSFPDLTEREAFDPERNAELGLAYLRSCLENGGNDVVALAMYNAGRSRVIYRGTPRMTLDHIAKIIEYRQALEKVFREQLVEGLGEVAFGRPESIVLVDIHGRVK